MTLYLHSLAPNISLLTRLAARERLLPPGDDLGYAWHAALVACFGERAPRSWAYLAPGQGGGPAGRLLMYSTTPLEDLIAHAEAFADPAFLAPLGLSSAATKRMPSSLPIGTRLGFSLRARPTVRTGRDRAGYVPVNRGLVKNPREQDAYVARVNAAQSSGSPAPTRAEVYAAWVARRLAGMGVTCDSVTMESHQLTGTFTRNRRKSGRPSKCVVGPDVRFSGVMTLTDPERLLVGLERGVGRMKAFGFGMLLLVPPRARG
jgi:CRISPR system Cascade subunit CasE